VWRPKVGDPSIVVICQVDADLAEALPVFDQFVIGW
jgi:hypothetical protein